MTNMWKGLAFAASLATGVIAASWHAGAAQPKDDPAVAEMPGHDHEHNHDDRFSAADRAAFFDARLAAMHAGLTLTADQEKLWPPVETAIRAFAQTLQQQHKAAKDDASPSDPIQKLQKISAHELARGQSLKGLADAAAPFYATLTDEQKHRLPVLMAHFHPRLAMFEGHERRDEDGHRQWSRERSDRRDEPRQDRD